MAGFSSVILNNAKSGISTHQGLIATTSNNITNVNTEGYSRRRAEVSERASAGTGLSVGQGVELEEVIRVHDKYLERVLQETSAGKGSSSIMNEFLDRAQQIFDITGEQVTVGSALEQFFTAISDLTINPASVELRANLLERGSALTSIINSSYQYLSDLQTEADSRLEAEIAEVNSLTAEIANLNGVIRFSESGGNEASTERDNRDLLLKQLSEKISAQVIEQSDGQVQVFLANGFNLVNSTSSRTLETTKTPSFVTGATPPSLEGGPLNYIVFDHDIGAGEQHTDLTNLISNGDGTLGGLLRVRGTHQSGNTSPFQAQGELVEIASYLEGISRTLLSEFNQVYLGVSPENLVSSGGVPTADDENGGTAVFDPSSGYFDEITDTSNPATLFGFFDFTGAADSATGTYLGLPDSGDLGDLEPTYYNFASRIKVAITDPNLVSTGRDLDPTAGTLEIQPGDSANLEQLVALREQVFSSTVGSYSINGTLSQTYGQAVTKIANLSNSARSQLNISESNLRFAEEQKNSYSGVSLDEEFTNLIRFQRAFQASSRLIRIADEVLQEMVNLI